MDHSKITSTMENNTITISGITLEAAEIVQTAVLQLSERTHIPEHAPILRRVAMEIDKHLKR